MWVQVGYPDPKSRPRVRGEETPSLPPAEGQPLHRVHKRYIRGETRLGRVDGGGGGEGRKRRWEKEDEEKRRRRKRRETVWRGGGCNGIR